MSSLTLTLTTLSLAGLAKTLVSAQTITKIVS
jgi:hypothetical protein